ncbi:MAG: BlaI/MecI/CopY family transcriptional regulator [Lachnospiraceae bacterium]|nr:BlaI/MecI/CopY family transcriptional regulator [Lachnospiraceae bacterium]
MNLRNAKVELNMKYELLTDAEKVVMKCAWDVGNGFMLSDIIMHVKKVYGKEWKETTVSTFLSKLVNKEYLEKYRDGKYIHYRIKVDMAEYRKHVMEEFVDFWYDGNMIMLTEDLKDIGMNVGQVLGENGQIKELSIFDII